MAAIIDVCQKQRAVIEFLVCEKQTVEDIHMHLQKVYGNDAVDPIAVSHWTKCLYGKGGHADIQDSWHIRRPHSAQRDAVVEAVKNTIMAERSVTLKQL
jgi:uncharacterized protein